MKPQSRTMKVKLWLRVENNGKFVRGKSKDRDEIERLVLSRFGMEKTSRDGHEYILSIPYGTDEELVAPSSSLFISCCLMARK
jgi:hypothetical protein